tara:strand:+ start:52 stop:372 length:321 start_codon:yes stop_codon:yes gene_type:complete
MESLLYFAEDTGAADSGAIMPASRFLGMTLVDANTAKLTFKDPTNTAKRTLCTVDFTAGTFKEACQAIAGSLNSNTMTVVADEVNGIYLSYSGGSFSGVVVVDDIT